MLIGRSVGGGGGSGSVINLLYPLDPCTTCGQLTVITTGSNLDQPVTQTVGADPTTGCQTLTVFCAGTSPTSDVILLVSGRALERWRRAERRG